MDNFWSEMLQWGKENLPENGSYSNTEVRKIRFPRKDSKLYSVSLTLTEWVECDKLGIGTKSYYGHISRLLARKRAKKTRKSEQLTFW